MPQICVYLVSLSDKTIVEIPFALGVDSLSGLSHFFPDHSFCWFKYQVTRKITKGTNHRHLNSTVSCGYIEPK